jgi:hypothetical protein
MKTIKMTIPLVIVLLLVTVPLNTICQHESYPQVKLMDTEGKFVVFDEVIKSDANTAVLIWNSNKKEHIQYLDQLNEQQQISGVDENLQIVAICTDKYLNYQKLQVLVAGRDWDFDFYLDVNESFMNANGISDDYLQTILIGQYESKALSLNKAAGGTYR